MFSCTEGYTPLDMGGGGGKGEGRKDLERRGGGRGGRGWVGGIGREGEG